MSKLLNHFVGIDISKQHFDAAVLKINEPEKMIHQQFEQSKQGLECFEHWLLKEQVFLNEHTLFCMEYTGVYNTHLVEFLQNKKAQIWVEMAVRIKKSMGFQRASNDKADAIKIAQYAYRHQDDCRLWKATDQRLMLIKQLLAQRERLVDTVARLTVPIKELNDIGSTRQAAQMEKLQKPVLRQLEKAIAKIEQEIAQ